MDMDLKSAYESQRRVALYRGIEWLFTYETWLEWWRATGKLHLRGNTKEKPYMMCRVMDRGAYSVDNVYCGTIAENNSDAWRCNPNHKSGGVKRLSKSRRSEIGKLARSKVKNLTTLPKCEVEKRIVAISHIDMTKLGWVGKVSNALNISHTQARRFITKYYQGEVYTRAKA